MPQDQHALVGGWRKGDRVSILVDHAPLIISKGDVGTVVGPATSDGADKADRVLVDFGEGKGRVNVFAKTQLEHATLVGGWRKGDRVSILVDCAPWRISKGDVGTVVGPVDHEVFKADFAVVDFGVGKLPLWCHATTELKSEATRVKVLELLGPMRAAERQRREASATSFYFLHASKVRNCSMKRLPKLQDLKRTHPNWIVKKPVDMTSSLLGDYRENMLATSHRWEHPDEPDTKGKQLAALKRYLDDHPEIEYVWFDFPCMPQKPRSPEDEDEFAEMLSNVNVIFLGMRVLVLLDISYMSRFWTQTEAWMSMQDASTSGLATAPEKKRRYTIVPLHNASAKLSETLIDMWTGKSAQEAHDILALPDVFVTNQSDKERQLPKILMLNETIKQTLEVHTERESALQQLARAMVAKDASTLTAALSVAEKADVAPANLQKGREALAAIQSAPGDRQEVLDAFTEAQRVAREAFDRAQQFARDKGVEVKLSSPGSTLNVTVETEADGKSDSLDLKNVWREHMVGVSRGSVRQVGRRLSGRSCAVQ